MRQTLVGPLSSRSATKSTISDPGKQLPSKGGNYVGRSYLPSGPSTNSGNVASLIGAFSSPSSNPSPSFKKQIKIEENSQTPVREDPIRTPTKNPTQTELESTPFKSNPTLIPKLPILKTLTQSSADSSTKTQSLSPTGNPEKTKRISTSIENRIHQLMEHKDPPKPQPPPRPPRKPLPQIPQTHITPPQHPPVQRSGSAPLNKTHHPPEAPSPVIPTRSIPVEYYVDLSPSPERSFVSEATTSLRKKAGSLLQRKREMRPKTAPVSSGEIWKYVTNPVRSGFLQRKFSWKDNKDQLWKKSYVVLDVKNIYIFKNERASSPPKIITLYGAFLKPNPKQKKKFTIITSEGACKFKETDSESIGPWLADIQKTCSDLVASSITEHSTTGRENAKEILSILTIPGNNTCADCGASDPKWGSLNFGVVICIECSGIHRSLGVHTSRVKSIELDNWDDESIEMMKSVGNEKANIEYEKNIPQNIKKPSPTDILEIRELYIRAKYIKNENELPKDYEMYPPDSPMYQRGKVVEEIVTTEGEFIKSMDATLKYFKKPLESNGILSTAQANTIFCNLLSIRDIHSQLLALYLEQAKQPDYIPKIVAVLEETIASSKDEYSKYMVGNEASINAVNQWMQNSDFATFCKQASSHLECRNLDLNSLLIKPIQRICKYPLLLRELSKNTSETDPEYSAINRAQQTVSEIVMEINTRMSKTQKLQEFKTRLGASGTELFENPDLAQNAECLREGALLVIDGKKEIEGYFFLFESFLLYTVPKDRHYQNLKLKRIILLDKAVVKDARKVPAATGYPDAFEITDPKQKKALLVNASSYLDKLMWMDDLEARIESLKS